MIYIIILFAKIIEVSLMTIRTVLITKGERKVAAVIGFIEVILWIYIASNVISDLSGNPLKAIAYAGGFALGNYFGSKLEEKIGIGLSEIKVNVHESDADPLAHELREDGFAVTMIKAHGRCSDRAILSLFVSRKKIDYVIKKVTSIQKTSFITTSDIKPVYGGYGLRK